MKIGHYYLLIMHFFNLFFFLILNENINNLIEHLFDQLSFKSN